jgi:predicted phosphodiesterase
LRYLLLSDIHSNLEGLEACLAEAEGKYDEMLCLGDLVGYGPDPNAVIERMRPLARLTIRGNHDRACCGLMETDDFNPLARFATDWTRQQLTPEHSAYLRSLPEGPVRLDSISLVHGSPLDEDEYIVGAIEALPALRGGGDPIVFFGHTHVQGGFMLSAEGKFQAIRFPLKRNGEHIEAPLEEGGRYLINPGSVGQPRDQDWRPAFAIFDDAARRVDFYRTPYDLPTTQKKMRAAGLPDPLIKRLQMGR